MRRTLAENVWNPEKRRSEARVLYNCGRADDADVTERLRRLAHSILRRCSSEEIVGAGGGDWRLVCAWPYGDVYVPGGTVAAPGHGPGHQRPGPVHDAWVVDDNYRIDSSEQNC